MLRVGESLLGGAIMKVPKVYGYVYKKLKEKKSVIVRTKVLKEVLINVCICKDGRGGNTKGMPREYLYPIVNDLIHWKLIRKIDKSKYELLPSNCIKELKEFPF